MAPDQPLPDTPLPLKPVVTSFTIDVQNVTPTVAREMIKGQFFPISDKNAPPHCKKIYGDLRLLLERITGELPPQGKLISFYGGGTLDSAGNLYGNLSWSTTEVPANQYSLYSW